MNLRPRPRPTEADIDALLDALDEAERIERVAHDALSNELARAMSLIDATLANLRTVA